MREAGRADGYVLQLSPPPRLFERLAQIPGFTWDQTIRPFHSTYDNWHIFGTQHVGSGGSGASSLRERSNSTGPLSPRNDNRTGYLQFRDGQQYIRADEFPSTPSEGCVQQRRVVARVTSHVLRIEREYNLCKAFMQTIDPDCVHIPRLIDLVALPGREDGEHLLCSIFEAPGKNYLKDIIDFGPAWLGPARVAPLEGSDIQRGGPDTFQDAPQCVIVTTFLDFAIGASECLEMLHHGLKVVHGELRADAFHFNQETRAVKLINLGAGPRSFEDGLSSNRWLALSQELGVKHKLQFIAPEQTGRMPAEPDSRTDIYSLGIIFWTLLTGKPAFDGATPLEVVQAVLSKRLAPASAVRYDVPDAISSIIQRMTQKQAEDRYHSVTGLKFDLAKVRNMLGDGDIEGLQSFRLGTKDVSAFFVLPTKTFGREEAQSKLHSILDKVIQRQQATEPTFPGLSGADNLSNSASSARRQSLEIMTRTSDASSIAGHSPALDPQRTGSTQESLRFAETAAQPSSGNGILAENQASSGTNVSSISQKSAKPEPIFKNSRFSGHAFRRRASQTPRMKHRCEVVIIQGAAGVGKSSLMMEVQDRIRESGYFSIAKFEPANKAPFEPLVQAMSALFRQIFSESDLDTEYHHIVATGVRPFWPFACTMLDLPESLLWDTRAQMTKYPGRVSQHQASSKSSQSETTVNSGSENGSQNVSVSVSEARASMGAARSIKFISVFVEILRVLSSHRVICLCIDNIHHADDESLELLSTIMEKKLGIMILATCRDTEIPSNVTRVLKNDTANVDTIVLQPLNEAIVIDYVSSSLSRPREHVLPLAILCLEKTNGNPFFMRQMLELCHRRGAIWYSWKDSQWEYNLDHISAEFSSSEYGQHLDQNFITRRLQDLPVASRAILAWASLIGTSFSFRLIQQILGSQFLPAEEIFSDCPNAATLSRPQPIPSLIGGLEAALQAYILVPGGNEDEYCFSHDRYLRAASFLRECSNIARMHFVIAETLMQLYPNKPSLLYVKAEHVRKALPILNTSVKDRRNFRDVLSDAASRAIESGARPTALQFLESSLKLLQSDPWSAGEYDVDCHETLYLHTKAAELYWNQSRLDEAQQLLDIVFSKAPSGSNMAAAHIVESRLLMERGLIKKAMTTLKVPLQDLGLQFAYEPTWDLCDDEYLKLKEKLNRTSLQEFVDHPVSSEDRMKSMGAVFLEIISAAFWCDSLLFYQLCIHAAKTHLIYKETFPQIGLALAYFAITIIGRDGDISYALRINSVSKTLHERHGNVYTAARFRAISGLFIDHLTCPIRETAEPIYAAIDDALISGDKHAMLSCVGGVATIKLFSGDNLGEIETYCLAATEDFGDYSKDLRGGAFVLGCRQAARALQGKTWTEDPDNVLTDDAHASNEYLFHISKHSSNPDRPRVIYGSYMLMVLYIFGHYDKATLLANELIPQMNVVWGMRSTRLVYLYAALSIAARLRENPALEQQKEDLIRIAEEYKARIVEWESHCDVNYRMWSLLVDAEIFELRGKFNKSILAFEAASSHAELHDFNLDLALILESHAGFFIRRGSKRAAVATMKDAMSVYSRIGATGKVNQMAAKNEFLFASLGSLGCQDAAVQTESNLFELVENRYRLNEDKEDRNRLVDSQNAIDRTKAWLTPAPPDGAETGFGLDILDLTSILNFSHAISSELDIDKLLIKMMEIILSSTGSQSDLSHIVTQAEGEWCIAATGSADGIAAQSLALANVPDETQKQVILYTTRFREVVFVNSVAQDDRFYNARTPKAVLSLPIIQGKEILGVLYLEGKPHSFTERTLGVLQLFCNQVSISIANALLFRKVAKVSAANASMVESQRRALAQAREAEKKAKIAEAEAMENVRLKEEAARVKSIFLANVSHELRTPLNGVIGMSELLKGTQLNNEQIGYADSIRVCADTLLTVINDILDFSKLEAGKMKLHSVPLNLKSTITEVVRALSFTNLERGLQTIEDLELDPSLLVMGDPVRLHQIFMNLLSNSYKFTSKGSVTISARTIGEDQESIEVTCGVADTGIGISQEQLNRLFKPFSQADSSTQRSYGGSGLGLSICKALINVLGGKINLESQLGVGTKVSFTVKFPKAPVKSTRRRTGATDQIPNLRATWSSDAATSSNNGDETAPFDLSEIPRDQLRICVAEDNPINQKIAISFVTKLGYQSEAFNDGLQAVEGLRRASQKGKPFHLVLMDCQMPILDGYDATRLIRKDEDPAVRRVKIVAMTASAIRGDREKCLEAGMNNYLAKPVRAAILKSMLDEYVAPRRHVPPTAIGNGQVDVENLAKTAISTAKS